MSPQKSEVFLSGVTPETEIQIRGILDMPKGQFPFRYLGVPLHGRGLRSTEFQGLLQKLRDRVQSWNARHLSYAGRLSLINSILYSIVRFWGSILFLPQAIIDQITQVCRDYLWSGA